MKEFRAAAVLVALFLLSAAAGAQQAVLWVPDPSLPPADILSLLEARPDLRLTAAFAELPRDAEERVRKLEKDGRLETALRLPGDPPLPLLYSPAADEVRWEGKPSTATLTDDPYFLGLRLGLARDAAAAAKRKLPAGFVNPPGGLAAGYFPLARAMGVKWIACGPLASTAAAVMEADGVYAVPFTAFSTAAAGGGLSFAVFDETSAADPAALRALLAGALAAPAPAGRLTVSEALKLAASTQTAAADLSKLASPWSGGYTRWAASPAQAGALAALARTRADLMLHLNAAQGNYKQAAPAFEEYFQAEEGGRLLALGLPGSEAEAAAEADILTALGNAYRLMQKPPPPWVFSGLGDAVRADEPADKLAVTVKNGGFSVANVRRKPEIPAAALPPGADPYKVWKLASFRAAPGPDEILFGFSPAAIDNSGRSPSGFSHIRLDLYIDINHRPRAGMARPLEGRPLRLFPDNAWEYALEIAPGRAALYVVTPKGPVLAGTWQPRVENGEITVRVPRSVLRGSPLLWGYAALLLAPGGKAPGTLTITDYIAADVSNGYIYAVRPGAK